MTRESDAFGFSNNGAALSGQDTSKLRELDQAEAEARELRQMARRDHEKALAARGDLTRRRDNYRWAIRMLQSDIGATRMRVEEQAAARAHSERGALERIKASLIRG